MIELREEIPVEEHKDLQSGFKGFEIKNNTEDRKSEHEGVEFFTPVTEEGFEHYYISQKGRVFNSKSKKLLKGGLTKSGYPRVSLNNSSIKTIEVHRLVALNFVDNVEDNSQVNHIDGNKENNHYFNLEWVTPKENITHAIENGLNTHKRNQSSRAKLLENRETIENLLEEGAGFQRVSDMFDCNRKVIARFAREFDMKVSSYRKILKSDIEKICVSYKEGKEISELAKRYNVSHRTIKNYIKSC